MALINNEGEPVSRWWISKAINILKTDREIFSIQNMRRARIEFIAGKNRVTTIKGWMLAAQLIRNGKSSKEFELTDFGLSLNNNDPELNKSSTWWAFHLATCFSTNSEPYKSFFSCLDTLSKDWISSRQHFEKIQSTLQKDNAETYRESVLVSSISSVRRMFVDNRPLADLGLIEISKIPEDGTCVRLGSPKLTDVCVIHALAMLRFHQLKSRSSVTFSELLASGLSNFLCCRPEELRLQLRRMHQSQQWQDYFSFNEAVNNDSLAFADSCDPKKTLLLLLQQGEDTWL